MSFLKYIFLLLFYLLTSLLHLDAIAITSNRVGVSQSADSFAFLGIEDGWITTDERHQILKLAKDGQLISLFNPKTSSQLADSKLLSASEDGTIVTRLIWNDAGDEFIEVINLSLRSSEYLALEGRFLRALRMSPSGNQIAALLSDGFIYKLKAIEKQLTLESLGSLPSVLASEWLIDETASMRWVSPDGQGFSKIDGQIKEQFAIDNRLQIASAYPLKTGKNTWLLQDEGQFLHMVNHLGSSISLGNPSTKISALLSFDWLLSYQQNGAAYVFHPLLFKRSQQEVYFQQILGTASHGIIGLSLDGKLRYLPISTFYKKLAANMAIHKRIAVEEITNFLANANIARKSMSSAEYGSQKNYFRTIAQNYLDASVFAWEEGKAGPDFDVNALTIIQRDAPIVVNKIQWENDRLSQEITANDELTIQLSFSGRASNELLDNIYLQTNENEAIPINQKITDENTQKLSVTVPALPHNKASWDITIQVGKEFYPLSVPVVQQEAQKVVQLTAIATIENNLVKQLQWSGQFLRSELKELSIKLSEGIATNNQTLAEQQFKTDEDGQFKANIALKLSQQLRVNTSYSLQIKRGEQLLLQESFMVEKNYPYTVKFGTKSPKNQPVYQHPLLRDLPKNRFIAENTFVLLMGNSKYKYAPEADFALRDVRLMHTYFTDVLGVPKNQVTVLENASLSDMVYYLGNENQEGRLMDTPNRADKRLIVYFSGHGMPSLDGKDGFLLPVDARLNRPDITAYQLSAFYEQLRILEMGETVVFLESCFSGRTGDGQSLLPNASASVGVQIKIPLLANDRVAIFTASDASELASWDRTNQTGLFTARVLEGFRHFAQQKRSFSSEDLALWLEDPKDGVYARARKWFSREQHPQLYANDSDLPLFNIKE